MRATLGPILIHLLILLAGLGPLRLAGVLPRAFSMRTLAAGGLAYLCGLGAALSLSILLLSVGGPFDLETFGVICVVLASPLLLDVPGLPKQRWARPRWLSQPLAYWREASVEHRAVVVAMTFFVVIGLIGMITLSGQPIDREVGYDTWNLWMRKASLLFFGSHLPLAILKTKATGYIQAYYPLGYSMLLAVHMRAMGVYETSTVHVVVWILLVAFVWAGAFLASQITRPAIWAALLPGTVFLVYNQASSGYADIPLAIFLCTSVLATGIWLERRRRGDLWVACMLLAGAAQIKNEGFIGAIIILVVAACYLLRWRQWAAIRDLAVGGAGVLVVAILPWRLWLKANHISGDHSLGETFNPVYLVNHFNRVWPSLKALESQITNQASTSSLIVIALALALVSLRGRSRHTLAPFYLGVGVLYFLSLLAAYWTSPFPGENGLSFYLETSVFRVVPGGLGFICVAAILHLSSLGSGRAPAATPPPGPDGSSQAFPPPQPTS